MIPRERLDDEHGRWLVTTGTSRYLLDVDRASVDVWPSSTPGAPALLSWELVGIEQCRLGQPLRLKVRSAANSAVRECDASPVTRLCRLFTQADVDAQRLDSHTG